MRRCDTMVWRFRRLSLTYIIYYPIDVFARQEPEEREDTLRPEGLLAC